MFLQITIPPETWSLFFFFPRHESIRQTAEACAWENLWSSYWWKTVLIECKWKRRVGKMTSSEKISAYFTLITFNMIRTKNFLFERLTSFCWIWTNRSRRKKSQGLIKLFFWQSERRERWNLDTPSCHSAPRCENRSEWWRFCIRIKPHFVSLIVPGPCGRCSFLSCCLIKRTSWDMESIQKIINVPKPRNLERHSNNG